MNRPLPPSDAIAASEPALFLAETVEELNQGANFLARLSPKDWDVLRREGTEISVAVGGSVFFQGDEHKGIWLIEERPRSHLLRGAVRPSDHAGVLDRRAFRRRAGDLSAAASTSGRLT
jgi:hypothetical protein